MLEFICLNLPKEWPTENCSLLLKLIMCMYEFQNYVLVTDFDERIKNSVNEKLIFVRKYNKESEEFHFSIFDNLFGLLVY